jgi:multiple sugar transport system permease protein
MSRLIVEHRVHWPELCSMASVIIIPVILVALFMQRYLVRGLTLGAVK